MPVRCNGWQKYVKHQSQIVMWKKMNIEEPSNWIKQSYKSARTLQKDNNLALDCGDAIKALTIKST